MELSFYIHYHSVYGESVFIKLRNGNSSTEVYAEYESSGLWKAKCLIEKDIKPAFSVYAGKDHESAKQITPVNRLGNFPKKAGMISIHVEAGINAFTNVFQSRVHKILQSNSGKTKVSLKKKETTFVVNSLPLMEGHVPCISGNINELGNWGESEPLLMKKKGDRWIARLDSSEEIFEFKFAVYNVRKRIVEIYEPGDNRTFQPSADGSPQIVFASPDLSASLWKGSGVNVAISSLRTLQTWGTGDFTSVIPLVDLCRKTGLKMIQLLPVNDTIASFNEKDSYPYAAISAFALHPLYLNVQKLAKSFSITFGIETVLEIQQLNELPKLDFEKVLKLKLNSLRTVFEIAKDSFRDDFNWFEFFELNREWLMPYAAFCVLRDKHAGAPFNSWKEFAVYDEDAIQELVSPENEGYDDVLFYYFIQYHLHLQLKDAVDYAHKNGVVLKGDLPIGVARNSVDAWMYPHLFNMDMQAGAPPDFFSNEGQNWNFPTYNWENMEKENFSWWRRRLEQMENYFDAVRIDHVIGLLRIWSIPISENSGAFGYFVPAVALTDQDFRYNDIPFDHDRFCKPYSDSLADVIFIEDKHRQGHFHFRINVQFTNSFKALSFDLQEKLNRLYDYYFNSLQQGLWQHNGETHLTMMQRNTKMMLCAEDLGMVPPMMEKLLADKEILSLQVMRMPKKITDQFSDPADATYLSVATPSTHDMSTIREWWESDHENVGLFYNRLLGFEGHAPREATPEVCTQIVHQHLQSPAMWSVFLLQDLLSMSIELRPEDPRSERMNDPANSDHVWDYRLHIPLEEIIMNKDFTSTLKKLIRNSGR